MLCGGRVSQFLVSIRHVFVRYRRRTAPAASFFPAACPLGTHASVGKINLRKLLASASAFHLALFEQAVKQDDARMPYMFARTITYTFVAHGLFFY